MTITQSRHTGARSLTVFALALLPLSLAVKAQDIPVGDDAARSANPCVALRNAPTDTRTFYLTNVTQQNDGRDVLNAVRNVLCPDTRVYLAPSQNAIIVEARPAQLTLADKIIHDLDRPTSTYRLTYTLTELDAGKTISTRHFSMLLGNGEFSSMKEGNKIPIATGTYANGVASTSPASEVQTQFTYLDVGMNFAASIAVSGTNVRLKSKVEDSSLDQPVTIAGVTEPVVRQSVLDGTAILTLDKPAMLGTIDVPNSTRHIDIAAVVEQIK